MMYQPSSPSPDPQWSAPRPPQNEGEEFGPSRPYSPPPTYLPAPVPPAGYASAARAARTWIRIPLERPFWSTLLLAIMVVLFAVVTLLNGNLSILPFTLTDPISEWGAKVNQRVVFEGQWWRLFTVMFLHNGLLHILSNGYALYVIGSEVEGLFGRRRFLAVFFISGLAGSVASVAMSPFNIPGVGASGAIFGLIGALGVYFGLHRSLFGARGNIQFWNIIFIVVINLGFGFSGILPIDNSAHLGGLIGGVLIGYILCPRYTLGEWELPNVRGLVDVNKGRLPWIAAGVFALVTFAIFLVLVILFTQDYLQPDYAPTVFLRR
ncbi:MAG: rhomboid family intramembrane serine protease [Chloroflexota bacterium]|nr:rhomboid family intramembrane serine protease [Chloroflexota bacterium]MDQ5865064.1 rhomboid family intramembrane serine protease [Chloroflexota bacterium]